MSAKNSAEFVKKMSEYMCKIKGFDSVMKNVKIVGGGDGNCSAEFKVIDDHLNSVGGLHGGFTATLLDNITTYALMSKNNKRGVSVHLYVDYFNSVLKDEEVIVNATAIKVGRTLAFLECEFKKKKDGSLIAKGGQTKFIISDSVKK